MVEEGSVVTAAAAEDVLKTWLVNDNLLRPAS